MNKYKKCIDLIKKTTKIQILNTLPECKNCMYYAERSIKEESICYKFGKEKQQVYGDNFYTVKHCRETESKCGSKAKYYISKFLQ
jgi:hypothetical protein